MSPSWASFASRYNHVLSHGGPWPSPRQTAPEPNAVNTSRFVYWDLGGSGFQTSPPWCPYVSQKLCNIKLSKAKLFLTNIHILTKAEAFIFRLLFTMSPKTVQSFMSILFIYIAVNWFLIDRCCICSGSLCVHYTLWYTFTLFDLFLLQLHLELEALSIFS